MKSEQPNTFHSVQPSTEAATWSEARHTPGPFVLSEPGKLEGRAGTYRQVIGEGGAMGGDIIAHVCVAHPYNHSLHESGEANARLFKAAPALLEACKRLMVCMALTGWENDPAAEYARAAIARAQGAS